MGHAWLLALVADPDELAAEVDRVNQGFMSAQRPIALEEFVPGQGMPAPSRRRRASGSGRPSVVDPHKLAYAAHLRDAADTIDEIVTKTGITRSSLYRHLPPRPAETITAAGTEPESR